MIQPIPELSSWRSTYSVCTYLYAYTHSGFQIPIRYVLVPYVCPPPASYNLSVGSEIGHSLPTFFNPARYPAFNKEKITVFIKAIMIVVGCQKLMDKEYFLTNGFKKPSCTTNMTLRVRFYESKTTSAAGVLFFTRVSNPSQLVC